jgi:BlaI family transcriptional regulator, penicillinase repressor
MARKKSSDLSRRERQIMDAIYRHGQATVADVIQGMADPPSYSSVRALLNILVEKGFLKVDRDAPRYVYRPTRSPRQVGRSRIKQLVQTFFDGSVEKAVAAMIETHDAKLTSEEIERLQAIVEQAREKGKP